MKNVSAEFKEAIKSDTLEIKGKVTFPGLEISDTTLSKIAIDADLVYDEDFEIGTAPMATAEVELVVDTGDEWGRNLLNRIFIDDLSSSAIMDINRKIHLIKTLTDNMVQKGEFYTRQNRKYTFSWK